MDRSTIADWEDGGVDIWWECWDYTAGVKLFICLFCFVLFYGDDGSIGGDIGVIELVNFFFTYLFIYVDNTIQYNTIKL